MAKSGIALPRMPHRACATAGPRSKWGDEPSTTLGSKREHICVDTSSYSIFSVCSRATHRGEITMTMDPACRCAAIAARLWLPGEAAAAGGTAAARPAPPATVRPAMSHHLRAIPRLAAAILSSGAAANSPPQLAASDLPARAQRPGSSSSKAYYDWFAAMPTAERDRRFRERFDRDRRQSRRHHRCRRARRLARQAARLLRRIDASAADAR